MSGIRTLFAPLSEDMKNSVTREMVDKLFFYKGKSVSIEDLGGQSERRMGKGRYFRLSLPCHVVTNEACYDLVFDYTEYDEGDACTVGVNGVLIMTRSLAD